jgi:hypothetical protein
MGDAGYQAITNRMLPLRGLGKNFDTWKSRLALRAVKFLQPRIRAWARNRTIFLRPESPRKPEIPGPADEFAIDSAEGKERDYFLGILLRQGWKPAGETDAWDVEKADTRVLMATERGRGIAKRTLVRVWGSEPARIARILGEQMVS